MRIELMQISVRDLVEGYQENDCEGGVKGYGGRLDIRPPFQREFVYGPAQRDAVIATLIKGYPLNVMYWSVRGDGTFEVIDGQQRTISIARYVAKKSFSVLGADGKPCYFHSLHEDERERMLDYQLTVYLCEGSDSERLAWFRTINIAGEKLYEQELRNAVYAGPWVSDAKRRFSKSGCVAYKMASSYLSGSPIRQDYLETAIKWVADGDVDVYMSKHQNDADAKPLWTHFQAVVRWIEATFKGKARKKAAMKKVGNSTWGRLYREHHESILDADAIEADVARLMKDHDVTRKAGIYEYALTGDERHLNIRAFDERMRLAAYEEQDGYCAKGDECPNEGPFELEQMEADHIKPWRDGGPTTAENCQMLCKDCNRRKGAK